MGSPAVFTPEEIINACWLAKEEGATLARVFSIEDTARRGPNGTKYMGLSCTTPEKSGRLLLRFTKEKHVGQIPPLDDSEVARMNGFRSGKYGMIKKRDRHPSIAIRKYPEIVDESPSEFYEVISLLNDFFAEEMGARLKDGRITIAPSSQDSITVPNTKIVSLVQTTLSGGGDLDNPICRVNLKFDRQTGVNNRMRLYDFSKSYTDGAGNRQYEALTFDGRPASAYNIHHIKPHSIVSGIVKLDSVCASNMGLSIPSEVLVLVVGQPAQSVLGVGDVFGDDSYE